MSFASFLSELKRRRVIRVIAVYAVAAWATMQFADLVFPRLGLPDWTVTLVIILAIIGLFVTIGIAWAFDFTEDGLKRTPSKEVQPRALPMRPHRALWFLAGIIVALTIGWFTVKSSNTRTAAIDQRLIAVLPFRVAGADPSLAYLREGMLDLMAATLVADDGTRAVDPPTVIAHWNQAVTKPEEDLPVDSARGVARRMRAGHVLIGSIIGSAASLTVNVDLVDVIKGGERRIRVTGSADSLPQLVDRVAGQVLAFTAGETSERASLLAGVPLQAIRAFVAGRQHYRAGDYTTAGREFHNALRIDSMFVLAAIGLRAAATWTPPPDMNELKRAEQLAWDNKDRLPLADRAELIANLGPHYPRQSTGAELLAAAREAVRVAPERPGSYNILGEWLYHRGAALGIDDAHAQARAAFNRVLELDPNLTSPAQHIAELSLYQGDTATVRLMAERILARDTAGPAADMVRIFHAMASQHEDELKRVRASIPKMPVEEKFALIYHAQAAGVSMPEAELVAAQLVDEQMWNVAVYFALNRGQPERAKKILAKIAADNPRRPVTDLVLLSHAMLGAIDTATANAAAQRRIAAIDDPKLTAAQRATTLCVIALWQNARGADVDVGKTVAMARADSQSLPCGNLLDAVATSRRDAKDAATKLAALDSALATAPAWSNMLADLANAQLAVEFERRGDPRAALRAARRRRFYLYTSHELLSPMLLITARLAAKAGEREAAITDYRRYITLMESAEAAQRPLLEAARRELNALVGESSR